MSQNRLEFLGVGLDLGKALDSQVRLLRTSDRVKIRVAKEEIGKFFQHSILELCRRQSARKCRDECRWFRCNRGPVPTISDYSTYLGRDYDRRRNSTPGRGRRRRRTCRKNHSKRPTEGK